MRQLENAKKRLENAESDIRRHRRSESQLRKDRDDLIKEKKNNAAKNKKKVDEDKKKQADEAEDAGTAGADKLEDDDRKVITDAIANAMIQGTGSFWVFLTISHQSP